MNLCAADTSPAKAESRQPVTNFVEDKIAEALAAIAQETQRAGIDEIRQKDAVARAHFRAHRIGRMPRVGADGKGVAAIRRKRHLFALGQRAVGKPLVENGADMRVRVVAWQIKLDRDA